MHFHTLVPDGYFATDPKTGRVRFWRDAGPSTADVEEIVPRIARRAGWWLPPAGGRRSAGPTERQPRR